MALSNTWQVQEAKNRLSEVLNMAAKKGPQIITRRGEEVGVVLSMEEYRKNKTPRENIVDFFRRSPLYGLNLHIERSKDKGRKIEL